MAKCDTSEEFRKLLADMVKACGEELIEKAEDLVGNMDLMSDFDIRITFPLDGRMLTGCPTIEIHREHVSHKVTKVLTDFYTAKKEENQDG